MYTRQATTSRAVPCSTTRSCTRPTRLNCGSRAAAAATASSGKIKPTSSNTSRATVISSVSSFSWRPPGKPTWPLQRSRTLSARKMNIMSSAHASVALTGLCGTHIRRGGVRPGRAGPRAMAEPTAAAPREACRFRPPRWPSPRAEARAPPAARTTRAAGWAVAASPRTRACRLRGASPCLSPS